MKLRDVLFLEVDDVIALQADAIDLFGGMHGVRDAGLLESAVMAARTGYYGSMAELAARNGRGGGGGVSAQRP